VPFCLGVVGDAVGDELSSFIVSSFFGKSDDDGGGFSVFVGVFNMAGSCPSSPAMKKKSANAATIVEK
jgi:hypothetical protein